MKRMIAIISVLCGILFFSACAGTSTAPTQPGLTNDIQTEWTVTYDNQIFNLALSDLSVVPVNHRKLNVVFPGSDMTAAQLRDYFAKAIVYTVVHPKAYQCPVYGIFYQSWLTIPDATVLSYVAMVEATGTDVPNIDPYTNPCD